MCLTKMPRRIMLCPSVLWDSQTPIFESWGDDLASNVSYSSLSVESGLSNRSHVYANDVADSSQIAVSGNRTSNNSNTSSYDLDLSSFINSEMRRMQSRHQRPKNTIPPPRLKYRLWFLPGKCSFDVNFDRLQLSALLDQRNAYEAIFVIILAMLVACLGYWLLMKHVYHDIGQWLLCYIIGCCQYSLIKSVQPDSVSPMHGYNRIVLYNRALYFSVFVCILLCFDVFNFVDCESSIFSLYSVTISPCYLLQSVTTVVQYLILCLPVIFFVGLLPQSTTCVLYVCEQSDMLIFGGSGKTSYLAAFASLVRSVIFSGGLAIFCYFSLSANKGEIDNNFSFSVVCSLILPLTFHLSRQATDPQVTLQIIHHWRKQPKPPASEDSSTTFVDPLPEKLRKTVMKRFIEELFFCPVQFVFFFALHVSSVFSDNVVSHFIWLMICVGTIVFGIIIHYLLPMMRKQLPWLCCNHPLLPPEEYHYFEVSDRAKIMWFEYVYIYGKIIEKYFLYPAVVISAVTQSTPILLREFSLPIASVIISVCSLAIMRRVLSDQTRSYQELLLTVLLFHFDFAQLSECPLMDFYVVTTFYPKGVELLMKLQFVFTYIAPWQTTWGSAFHAFAQPFSVPHTALLFTQAVVAAIVSCPLSPFLGSALFILSYPRPVKFWERNYNTKRQDVTNQRLAHHLDKQAVSEDDDSLNSIFYEHLTRLLQESLAGDLELGRWGNVEQGDFFILASDNLNCMVHIVESGNGLVTFQLRGLEFRGTYCQQREVEAIMEGPDDDNGCCCCYFTSFCRNSHLLSINAAFGQRWLAWEIISTKFILEGYSVSENNATLMLQTYEYKRSHMSSLIRSVVYYLVRSPKLDSWLTNKVIQSALSRYSVDNEPDLDAAFVRLVDEDFDEWAQGVTRSKFCQVFRSWVEYCQQRRTPALDASLSEHLLTLCFGLSVLGRRALWTATHYLTDSFLSGLHALFKGDLRITAPKDEWVFQDMDLFKNVVGPAIRMSVKLHMDHFATMDEYESESQLYNTITSFEKDMVISHESDPNWRNAVLSNVPSLLTLRHVMYDSADEYKVIQLNKRFLNFRVVKLNKECVRSLWAGQQQELIFLRNRNPERGSIQNAKQALRNMINSSCDQPIGYPIYVSPLTTSYTDTNQQLASIALKGIRFSHIRQTLQRAWSRFIQRCLEGFRSGQPVDCGVTYNNSSNVVTLSVGSMRTPTCPPVFCESQQDPPSAIRQSQNSIQSNAGLGGQRISTTSNAPPT